MSEDEKDFLELFRKVDLDVRADPAYRAQLWQRMVARAARAHQDKANSHRAIGAGLSGTAKAILPKLGIAASVAAAIGVAAWMLLSGPAAVASESFADVVQQVRDARTVSYTKTFHRGQAAPYQAVVQATNSGRVRTTGPEGKVQILDYQAGKTLILGSKRKTATIREFPSTSKHYDPVVGLRDLHETDATFVGRQQLAGKPANVFRIERDDQITTIWADRRTDLPIRLRIVQRGQTPPTPGQEDVLIIGNFVWNVVLPDSLFSLEFPPGYVSRDEYDGPPTEAHLVDTLRRWAQLSDGVFPGAISMDTRLELFEELTKANSSQFQLTPSHVVGRVTFSVGLREFLQSSRRGLRFVKQQTDAGNDWHYRGGGVTLGDKESPLCWWRPSGSTTYRVVYGDLTIRDVEPSALRQPPATPDSQPVQDAP